MPGHVLNLSSLVQCAHGAPAQPTAPVPTPPRVTILGQAVMTEATAYVVAGCPNTESPPNPVQAPPAPPPPFPCATATWIGATAATRVKTMGLAVLVMSSTATCAPTGREAKPVQVQSRVQAI